MSAAEEAFDDLTKIRGIGPVRQEWLRVVLDVQTFADLAALTADEIDEKLRDDGHIVSHSDIEFWIQQAKELKKEPAVAPFSVDEASVEAVKEANATARNGDWKPYASFVVEFQARIRDGKQTLRRTVVHHIETDKGTFWEGAESEGLCSWMLEKAGEMSQVGLNDGAVQESSESMPSTAAPVKVRIGQIHAFQPPLVEFSGGEEAVEKWPTVLQNSEPFNLALPFSLTGDTALYLSRTRTTFRTRLFAINLATNTSFDLGEPISGYLIAGEVDYCATFAEISLEPGTYRLWATVTIQAHYTIPDFTEASLLVA